uniref:Major facilitator superfamily (MFS) profile domain-containing protein n=1 Tax=Photinus pyralis TaxID=7054 RepID=A0A1Y1K9U0_PHOPY
MVVVDISKVFPGRIPQILATVTGTLTALSDGMQYGWSAPIIPLLQQPSSPVKITNSDIVWIENTFMLGGLAGIPLTIYLLDKLGRKNSMLIAAVENLIAWLLLIFASSSEVILVARFLTGFAGDCNFVATPMYIAEIADKKIRGRLGALIFIMMLMGILLIYSIGPFISIAASSSVGAAVIITQLLTFSFMPESPYYLLVKNRKEEARQALRILRGTEDVDRELEEIAQAVEEENRARGRPLELFTVKSNRKAIIIMSVLNFAQHFSGVSVILMNLHMILEDAATNIPPSIIAIIFSVLMLFASGLSALLIDSLGRKILLYTSCFLTAVTLLLLATYFACKNNDVNMEAYSWVPAVAVISYAITFKCGLGLIPIVLTAELFPTNVKALGCTVSDAMYIIGSVSSIYAFHFLHMNYGMHVPFFLFGCACLLTGIFSLLIIPETKGKTLDEIQKLLKGEESAVNGACVSDADSETIPLLS